MIDIIFVKEMLEKNNVNNEQLGLAILWNQNNQLFNLIENNYSNPCYLFTKLSK